MRPETPKLETVSGFVLANATAEPSSEGAQRWAQRDEVLAAWLADQWRREQDQLTEGIARHCDLN